MKAISLHLEQERKCTSVSDEQMEIDKASNQLYNAYLLLGKRLPTA